MLKRALLVEAARTGIVAPIDPLAALSDAFDSGPMAILDRDWLIHNGSVLAGSAMVSMGALMHTATAGGSPGGSFWFNATQGYLIYKLVSGDCDMRARQTVTNVATTGLPPASSFRIAGIAMHDPDRTLLNYTHIGMGPVGGPLSFETKNTVNNVSAFPAAAATAVHPWTADIRLTRVGTTVTTYYRESVAGDLSDDSGWTQHQQYTRADFPSEMQWGMMVYSNQTVHDIAASVDEVLFSTP